MMVGMKKMSNALKRVLTGLAIVAGLALALTLRQFLTVFIFDIVLLVMLFFAVFEVMRATKAKDKGIKYYFIFGYLGIAYVVFFIGNVVSPSFGFWVHVAAQVTVLFVFVIYTYLMYYVDKAFIKQCKLKKLNIGKECWRVMLGYLKIIGYPAAFIYALFALNHFNGVSTTYPYMGLFSLLLVFVIAAATDTFAYLVGITLKGPKICPKISPKKTWSGAVGGVFGAVIATLTLVLIFSTSAGFSAFFTERGMHAVWVQVVFVVVGLLGSVVAQAGDILASYIKRKHDIKDFGKILPGHGGVMDRIDGHIATGVFIFLTMCIICFIM